jgi:predicted dehydrogenase
VSSSVGLVLGYGSIGRVHARVMRPLVEALVIVDGDEQARTRAGQDHPDTRVAADLDALRPGEVAWSAALAVIATWGPSHAALFHRLVDRGVRRILCEKPLAASVADADGMVARAWSEGVALVSHHYMRYSGFTAALGRLAAEHRVGEPLAVVVDGGATCLVTNGLHWIDFARQLFGGQPERVVSTARSEPINPRSSTLGFYGGSVTWSFADGRMLTLAFSNLSSVYPVTRVHFRHAVASIDYYYDVQLTGRNRDAVDRFPSVTRTGPADEVLFKGPLPGVLGVDESLTLALTELQRGETELCPGRDAASAVNACIGMLVAGRDGRAVDLPLDGCGEVGREAWPIS